MRRLTSLAVALLMATGAFAQVTTHTEIKTPPLRKFSMPQPKRIVLDNGMVVFLQEDHELPLIEGSATIRGGARNIPAAKAGLASIYGQAWRNGGTTTRKGEELDVLLEARAARLETSTDADSSNVSMDVLKGDFDTVFPLWLDLLRNPAFAQDKIDLAKTQANTAISRRNDEPGEILSRELQRLGYGPNSPYARQPEYATIASITRDDLLAFHKQTVHPNNIIVAFIGDFDAAQMEKRLRSTFASWPRGPQVTIPDPAMTPAKPGIYFIAKEDVTQANIAMVHPGSQRNNPDAPAITVANEVLSGGFSGRLMQTLRSQRGLTYGAGGSIGVPWDYPGLFRVQMSTKSGTTLESIEALRGEVRRMIDAPATAQELSLAKESILNAFVFTMDTREKALQQQVLLEFYGFPADYYTKWPGLIEKVTAADVARVAKTYLHPDQLAVLVVGNEKDFEKPLSSLGTVTPIDITIPEPGARDKSAAPAASNPAGKALVNKIVQFVGGATAINALQTLRRTGSVTMSTPQGEMEAQLNAVTRFSDGAERVEMQLPMGQITRVVTPQSAFVITPMGTQDLPSSQRDSSLGETRAELLNVLRNAENPKYTFTVTGTETVGGVNATVLSIDAEGTAVKWYVEPSGRVLRTASRASAPMPGEIVTDLSEWKSFGGINLPTLSVMSRDGEKAGEMRMSNVEVNPAVDANAFAKP
ncbi:MAG TPA: insulinase family protein [Thermoanaerobaculia bacterium]|jgi:zinc protease